MMTLVFFHREKHFGRGMELKEHIWILFVRLLIQQIFGGEFQQLMEFLLKEIGTAYVDRQVTEEEMKLGLEAVLE